MTRSIIFYITVSDASDNDIIVMGPYLGGIMCTQEGVENLARDLVNDRSLPGAVMTKIYELDDITVGEAYSMAKRQFNTMADEMDDMQRIQKRMRKR